jgi:hypothetical protein
MGDQAAHSDIGASSLYRWAACPASVRLSKGIVQQSSSFAEEGTLAHEYASDILLSKGKAGQLFPAEFPDMRDAVYEYVVLIREEWEADRDEGDVLLVEHRFHLKKIHPDAFGTADCVMYKHKARTLKVFDYKHGKGHVVSVRNNAQLKYYALGAILSLPQLKPTAIESIIVQPRAYHEEGSVRRETNTPMDILNFSAELVEHIKATLDPNAPIIAGDHCHFCPAKPHCPLLHEKMIDMAKQDFNTTDAQISGYDVEKLSRTLDMLTAVEAYISGVREFAYKEAERGIHIPNYKLVAKRAQRKWTDENGVAQRLAQRFNPTVTNECRTLPELKSVAQIEKVIGKKVFNEIMGDLVVSVSSGTVLTEENDSRAPMIKGAEFNAITHKSLLE